MSFLENPVLWGAAGLVAGSVAGYWLWRWHERNFLATLALKEQQAQEDARRQGDTLAREARLQANEAALKIHQDTEASFARHHQELSCAEKRLFERGSLINRQLENIVEDER